MQVWTIALIASLDLVQGKKLLEGPRARPTSSPRASRVVPPSPPCAARSRRSAEE